MGIQEAANGIALPNAFHAGLHTKSYYQNIADRLTKAWDGGGAAGVREELGTIGGELGKAAEKVKKAMCAPTTGSRIPSC